jgi:hypothetical protein
MFPAENAQPAAVISRGATLGNHFTVYQIPAIARRQDGDVIPKRKKWQKRKRRRSGSGSDESGGPFSPEPERRRKLNIQA